MLVQLNEVRHILSHVLLQDFCCEHFFVTTLEVLTEEYYTRDEIMHEMHNANHTKNSHPKPRTATENKQLQNTKHSTEVLRIYYILHALRQQTARPVKRHRRLSNTLTADHLLRRQRLTTIVVAQQC